MAKFLNSFLDGIDSFLAWLSTSLKQTTESYCDLETADSPTVLSLLVQRNFSAYMKD
jgi:intracellular multiplication protein IcmB